HGCACAIHWYPDGDFHGLSSMRADPGASRRMKVLIVGYGKMGRLVEQLAIEQGEEIAGRIDVDRGDWPEAADVAIDFSTADALGLNFPKYLERRLPVVIGTTGWADQAADFRSEAERAGLGVIAAANFSVGVNLFELMVAEAARLMSAH